MRDKNEKKGQKDEVWGDDNEDDEEDELAAYYARKKKYDMGKELRFKMDDYWLKTDDPRSARIFRAQHPLIFLTEKDPGYKKI